MMMVFITIVVMLIVVALVALCHTCTRQETLEVLKQSIFCPSDDQHHNQLDKGAVQHRRVWVSP